MQNLNSVVSNLDSVLLQKPAISLLLQTSCVWYFLISCNDTAPGLRVFWGHGKGDT